MDDLDLLASYRQKRDFNVTPEPAPQPALGGNASKHGLRFMVQKHWARNLHYDFRLEFEGTLKSWAVPKGPSLDPHVKRMAVRVEDHPLSYGDFEGVIPAKQYGAGRVIVWDSGLWLPMGDAAQGFKEGKLKFELCGHKLLGRWTLVRMRSDGEKQVAWLLIKEHDKFERASSDYDITEALPDSVGSAENIEIKPKSRAVIASAKKTVALKIVEPSDLPVGSVKASLPEKIAPQLATLAAAPPEHDEDGQWIYELKFDGYRLMARLGNASTRCFTRNGHDWTEKLPHLVQSLVALGVNGTWLDGEIVMLNDKGVPSFQHLQKAFESPRSGGASAAIIYYVFDMPFFQGYDLRGVALHQRRALLEKLLGAHKTSDIRFSAAFDAPSKDLLLSACKMGLEGLIGKRADSAYESRRSPNWIKLKCSQRQPFLICGYTDPQGARTGFGALLLGHHDASGILQYAGNVGSGFSEKTLVDLMRQLQTISTAASPFASKPAIAGKPHWVKPTVLVDVSFAEWTHTGRIRHGVFRGVLRGKQMETTKLQAPSKQPDAKRIASTKAGNKTPSAAPIILPASLRLTHPDRIIDAHSGLTKLDMVKHYARVAAVMLPHLKGRPVSLVRAPDGTTGKLFFQKHANAGEIPHIKLLDEALDPGHASLLEISNVAGLLSAAQMNALEFHTWNAVAASIAKPDRMIFDLDPGEKVAWPEIQEAALLLRTLLEALGLVPFIKTSGGKGLHVVVPLKKLHDWDTVKSFSRAVVEHLAKTIPQKFVAKSGPKNRVGKIFVDYLRNGFGATTVSAWSARARPGLGVSVPIAWNELQKLSSSAHWTVENIAERVAMGNSVWDGYTKSLSTLHKAMKLLDFKR